MPKYIYCECPVCEFSLVLNEDTMIPPVHCSLCAGDSGRDVKMLSREARPTDIPEGHDARKLDPSITTVKEIEGAKKYIKEDDKVLFIDHLSRPKFQARVFPWMIACFGEELTFNSIERNHRFLEEALELVQSLGCSREDAHQLVDYVFDRPAGVAFQEVGGVKVTLAALGLAHNIDVDEASEAELARIWTNIKKIRAKQKAKPKFVPPSGPDKDDK